MRRSLSSQETVVAAGAVAMGVGLGCETGFGRGGGAVFWEELQAKSVEKKRSSKYRSMACGNLVIVNGLFFI